MIPRLIRSGSVLITLVALVFVTAIRFASEVSSSQRIFTADYSTGDFSQWRSLVSALYNTGQFGYALPTAGYEPTYPASIIDDPVKGKAARYEIRAGDFVPKFENVQISEVAASTANSGGFEGQTTWYAFSTRFDSTFPQIHADLGWGLTNEWHIQHDVTQGNPPICMTVQMRNGYWSLTLVPQTSPNVRDRPPYSVWDVPLGTEWHDMKLQIHWSQTDGWIRLWHNGVRQTLLGGVDTYWTPTLVGGTTSVYYMEGYYRKPMESTGIVYQQGFRVATDEDEL